MTNTALTNKVYDILKWIAQFFLPALGTLYFALSGIWGFPYGEQVVGTITAIVAFLGVILGISSAQYKKNQKFDGDLVMATEDGIDNYKLVLGVTLEELAKKDTISFKVDTTSRE